MKRLVLLAMCAWPVAAGAQDGGNPQALEATVERLIPVATMAGAAQQCGIRNIAWEANVIKSLSVTVGKTAVSIWGISPTDANAATEEMTAVFNAGRMIQSAIRDGAVITTAQCQSRPNDPSAVYLAQADAAAAGFAQNGSEWNGN